MRNRQTVTLRYSSRKKNKGTSFPHLTRKTMDAQVTGCNFKPIDKQKIPEHCKSPLFFRFYPIVLLSCVCIYSIHYNYYTNFGLVLFEKILKFRTTLTIIWKVWNTLTQCDIIWISGLRRRPISKAIGSLSSTAGVHHREAISKATQRNHRLPWTFNE